MCIKLFSTLLHLPGAVEHRQPARDQVFQGGGGLYLYRAQAGAHLQRFNPESPAGYQDGTGHRLGDQDPAG